jgi:chromosome segregation ATPase
MKGCRREKWVVVTAATLFGVALGILNLACEEQPEVRTDAPASAKAKPDTPSAPAAPKAAAARETRGFDNYHSHVQDLGNRLEGLRAEASGDLGVALGELEAEQAQLMAELDAIGGDNEKWDAARAELAPQITDLREQIRELREKVNE